MYLVIPFIIWMCLISVACDNTQNSIAVKSGLNETDTTEINSEFEGLTVGYSTPSLNAPFYVALSEYVKMYAESHGMTFILSDGQDDIIKQITSIEDLVSTGVDILILNPLDHKALVPAANTISGEGIPIFILDSQIDPDADYITSVQASNEKNGELLGEWIVRKFGNRTIEVAIISGSKGNPVGREKRLGFVRGFTEAQLRTQGNADVRIVSQGWGNWTLIGGLEAMEDILAAHPEVDLLVAENDAMGMGALKAIREAGKSDDIMVVGFDGQKEAYELIQSGDFDATALNSPQELARLIIEAIVDYLNGNHPDRIIHTPAVIITRENVDQYYNAEALF
jgi:ribose transport system substrate-binding protein